MKPIYLLILAGLLGGCKAKLHLGYDYGRAFVATIQAQADLTRPGALGHNIFLYGPEAAAIRMNVQADTTEMVAPEGDYTPF